MYAVLKRYNLGIFKLQFILFGTFLLIGTILANRLDANRIDEYKLLSGYFINKFPDTAFLNMDLFKHIIWERFRLFLIIWVFGFTFFEVVTNTLFVMYFGFSIGYLFSVGLITNGFKGYFFNLILLLPHYLIYIPIMLYLLKKSLDFSKKVYGNKSRLRGIKIHKQMLMEYILVLILCALFVIIGCFFEAYINPQLVNWYISTINL